MIRRPPRSTLFPYTNALPISKYDSALKQNPQLYLDLANAYGEGPVTKYHDRSEEHTSELQSQSNIVCRLLLEKKIIARLIETSTRALPFEQAKHYTDSRRLQR